MELDRVRKKDPKRLRCVIAWMRTRLQERERPMACWLTGRLRTVVSRAAASTLYTYRREGGGDRIVAYPHALSWIVGSWHEQIKPDRTSPLFSKALLLNCTPHTLVDRLGVEPQPTLVPALPNTLSASVDRVLVQADPPRHQNDILAELQAPCKYLFG